jgi:hypothetical protein
LLVVQSLIFLLIIEAVSILGPGQTPVKLMHPISAEGRDSKRRIAQFKAQKTRES